MRGWHWALTDVNHQEMIGEILWLVRKENLDILLLNDVHTSDVGRLNSGRRDGGIVCSRTFSIQSGTATQSRWASGETTDSSNQGQRERQGKTCSKFPKKQRKENDNVSRTMIKTRHGGELHNRRHFMPVAHQACAKSYLQGPPPSWHLRERWRCEVAVGPHGSVVEVAQGR